MKLARLLTCLVATVASCNALASPSTEGTPLRVADLRSFFHGEPPPVPKAPPPKQLAIVTTAPGQAADLQVENFMKAFAAALMARDGKAMVSRLSDKYRIDDLPDASKKPAEVFQQAVERIPSPTEIHIISVEAQGNARTAKMEFRFGADSVKQKTFRFDAEGKLLWSDLFKLQVQGHGA